MLQSITDTQSNIARQFCHEIEVSRLPAKLRDRVSARLVLCYVESPRPKLDSARTPYITKVAATPQNLSQAKEVPLTLDEYAALCVLLTETEAPLIDIHIAPAYFFPELEQELRVSLSFYDDPDTIPNESDCVCIASKLFAMPIAQLSLAPAITQRFAQADIDTVGQILELDEEALGGIISEKDLYELVAALHTYNVFPTNLVFGRLAPSCARPARSLDIHNEVYFAPSDITADGKRLVRVSLFADRLTGRRTGTVYEAWLSEKQIAQSMPWTRVFEQLDSYERRERVYRYVLSHGAAPAPVRTEAVHEVAIVKESLEQDFGLVVVKDPLYLRLEDVEEQEKTDPLVLLKKGEQVAERYLANLVKRMHERIKKYASTDKQERRSILLALQRSDSADVQRLRVLHSWIDTAKAIFQKRTRGSQLPIVSLSSIDVPPLAGYQLSLALPYAALKNVLEQMPRKYHSAIIAPFHLSRLQKILQGSDDTGTVIKDTTQRNSQSAPVLSGLLANQPSLDTHLMIV